ncbi:proteasome regulatory particle lid subunit [Saccharomycopsis crataegensis]|uniref:Proteasome regulatory particle lid subunit n=1 Tax=Saccharomycopsis crataegensis TaxID=43959 RepID=A0AAV5QH15_9ASCO|nr:proteasome regulatory particle lid subunit [Saccharomycopsis crataegensis]
MSKEFETSGIERVPDFQLPQYAFELTNPELKSRHPAAIKYITTQIEKEDLAPYYYYLHHEYFKKDASFLPWDETMYENLKSNNDAKIKELNNKITTIEEEDEDNELDKVIAITKLGEYYAKIGDRSNAIKTLRKAFELSSSTGTKIDILLTISRIGFFFNDLHFTEKILSEASLLIEKGGDWERRNRYKTYYGIHLMSIRNFEEAAKLLVDSLSTFTSTEIATYEQIAVLAVLAGLLVFERKDHKKKIVDSPEILSLVTTSHEVKLVTSLSDALYHTQYQNLFPFLSQVYDEVLISSQYLSIHANYYIRELRRKAYAQLLDSYKALSLKSMAEQFGVSVEFLDNDLCKFIPNKKLNCVIDRVNGIVETNRPDNKNAQYQLLIKQGDSLLTKLQKYGAAVKLSGTSTVA